METFLADFLRGAVSAAMNVVLLISLLQPKYSRKVTNLVMLTINVKFIDGDFLL